jgi:DNA-binding MarR family transcriptional regulator
MDAVYTAPGYLFRRMQQIAVSVFVEECRDHGLTPVQYAALVAIHTHPGIDATRLSAVIAFDRSTLGSVIERLEVKSYVERKPAREDRRVKLLTITKAGARLLREIAPAVARAQARMLQPLKPADRKTLLALMTQLVDLNNEASRVPLRAEDALEHLGKAN